MVEVRFGSFHQGPWAYSVWAASGNNKRGDNNYYIIIQNINSKMTFINTI